MGFIFGFDVKKYIKKVIYDNSPDLNPTEHRATVKDKVDDKMRNEDRAIFLIKFYAII